MYVRQDTYTLGIFINLLDARSQALLWTVASPFGGSGSAGLTYEQSPPHQGWRNRSLGKRSLCSWCEH